MTQSIIDYRLTTERKLRAQLGTLLELKKDGVLKMQYDEVDFAITKNADTYSPCSVKKASFHPVANFGDLAIIVFITDCDASFGLYDEDREACLPIDIHEVVSTWIDEQAVVQRDRLDTIRRILQSIIEDVSKIS